MTFDKKLSYVSPWAEDCIPLQADQVLCMSVDNGAVEDPTIDDLVLTFD